MSVGCVDFGCVMIDFNVEVGECMCDCDFVVLFLFEIDFDQCMVSVCFVGVLDVLYFGVYGLCLLQLVGLCLFLGLCLVVIYEIGCLEFVLGDQLLIVLDGFFEILIGDGELFGYVCFEE